MNEWQKIKNLFETALNPTEAQTDRIYDNILTAHKNQNTKRDGERKMKPLLRKLVPIAASIAFIIAAGTIANAATGGALVDGMKNILMTSGFILQTNEDGTSVIGTEATKWAVKESWGKLIIEIDKQKIDITKDLKSSGFYRYEYRDEIGVLHNVIIAKNMGEEDMERWYSQMELLPELGDGAYVSTPEPLARAQIFAGYDVDEGVRDYDTALQYWLEQYWNGTLPKTYPWH